MSDLDESLKIIEEEMSRLKRIIADDLVIKQRQAKAIERGNQIIGFMAGGDSLSIASAKAS